MFQRMRQFGCGTTYCGWYICGKILYTNRLSALGVRLHRAAFIIRAALVRIFIGNPNLNPRQPVQFTLERTIKDIFRKFLCAFKPVDSIVIVQDYLHRHFPFFYC